MTDRERLRIGVDGYNLAMPHGTGVATYGRTLCRAIDELGFGLDLLYGLNVPAGVRAELRETLFFARLGDEDPAGQPPPASLKRSLRRAFTSPLARDMVAVPVGGRVIVTDFTAQVPAFERLFTLTSLFSVSARFYRRFGRFLTVRVPDPPAIMHWTYPVPVRLAGARNIYTIHDLVPLRLPHTSLEDKRYYDRLIGACIRNAAHIVTVSEASRTDIVTLFGADPARVTNTYQPVDLPHLIDHDRDADLRLRRLFDLERGGYFLFFGAIEPKKNVGRLIEAYLSAGIDTPLVIVGSRGWRSEQELRLLGNAHGGQLAAAGLIRRMDHLPRALLAELMRSARAVVFPSLYEGFGLPALEALALGVPLLTSNASSLPEVVGDAAIMVDPYDVQAITQAIRRLDGDAVLRAELAAKGPIQAGKFHMQRYRQAIDALYRSIM